MKIGIVGLGLIGGSLGLDLTKLGYQVIGVSRQQSTCDIAVANQVVSNAGVDLTLLSQTDLIFICTPIAAILKTIEKIVPYLAQSTIITDVGSVKTAMFQDAPCVISSLDYTPPEAIATVSKIWQKVGCRIHQASPEIHDQAVAWISHLAVMISANLLESCSKYENQEVISLAQRLASSGFRDTSRVGGGNVDLGLMMAQYNREQLLVCLREYQRNLNLLIGHIEEKNWEQLQTILTHAQQQRPKFVD